MFGRRFTEYCKFLKSLLLTNGRLLRGMWKLTKLQQPAVTIFGGSRLKAESIYAKKATQLAEKLASNGFSILTGGGSGIMEAANFGAVKAVQKMAGSEKSEKINRKNNQRISSMGIGLFNLGEIEEKKNPYVYDYIVMYHFFSRKWLLVRYAIGFVAFPGGFGTLDELFEVITLIQCNRMPAMPVVLMGKDYWQPILDWASQKALDGKFIREKDLKIIHLTDDIDDAYKYIVEKCRVCGALKTQPFYTELGSEEK